MENIQPRRSRSVVFIDNILIIHGPRYIHGPRVFLFGVRNRTSLSPKPTLLSAPCLLPSVQLLKTLSSSLYLRFVLPHLSLGPPPSPCRQFRVKEAYPQCIWRDHLSRILNLSTPSPGLQDLSPSSTCSRLPDSLTSDRPLDIPRQTLITQSLCPVLYFDLIPVLDSGSPVSSGSLSQN